MSLMVFLWKFMVFVDLYGSLWCFVDFYLEFHCI